MLGHARAREKNINGNRIDPGKRSDVENGRHASITFGRKVKSRLDLLSFPVNQPSFVILEGGRLGKPHNYRHHRGSHTYTCTRSYITVERMRRHAIDSCTHGETMFYIAWAHSLRADVRFHFF